MMNIVPGWLDIPDLKLNGSESVGLYNPPSLFPQNRLWQPKNIFWKD